LTVGLALSPRLDSDAHVFSEEERKKVLHWMSEIDYSGHRDELSKNLLPGSGQWLLQSQEYINWAQSSVSSIFWLHGKRK